MNLSDFKEDADKQTKGSPCYIGEGYFNVCRIGGSEYLKQIEEIKLNLYGFSPKNVDENEVMAHWLVEYGVTGWGGIFDGDETKPVEYNKQNARAIFLDKSYWKSLNMVLINHGSNYANYLHDEVEKDVEEVKKN